MKNPTASKKTERKPASQSRTSGIRNVPEAPLDVDGSLASRVRARAFEIFCARQATGSAGDAESDWLNAERECCRGTGLAASAGEQPQTLEGDPGPDIDPPIIGSSPLTVQGTVSRRGR